MVHLACAHTCRNGELCGLTWDTVDLEQGMLKINKTMQRVSKNAFSKLPKKEVFRIFPNKVDQCNSFLVLKTPKTKGSVRWLHLTRPIVEELSRRKQQVEKNKLYYGEEYRDYNLVFCQDDGTPVETNLCEKWFRKWQERNAALGLPTIVFHSLRHSAATLLMYLSGSDAKTVQTITGHSSAKLVFDVYNHPLMNHQKQLVEKLERVMYHGERPDSPEQAEEFAQIATMIEAMKKDPLLAQKVFSALHADVAATATFSPR